MSDADNDLMTAERPVGDGGRRRCAAKSKQTGKRCKQPPAPGRNTCRFHGGASPPAGIGHHAVKRGEGQPNGRYSKVLPKNISELYERAAAEDASDLSPEICLLQARIEDVAGRLADGAGRAFIADIRRAWQAFGKATAEVEDAADETGKASALLKLQAARARLGAAIATAGRQDRVWGELSAAVKAKQEAVVAHTRAVAVAATTVSLDQARAFVAALLGAVIRHVADQATRAAINRHIQDVLSSRDAPRAVEVGGADGPSADKLRATPSVNGNGREAYGSGD